MITISVFPPQRLTTGHGYQTGYDLYCTCGWEQACSGDVLVDVLAMHSMGAHVGEQVIVENMEANARG